MKTKYLILITVLILSNLLIGCNLDDPNVSAASHATIIDRQTVDSSNIEQGEDLPLEDCLKPESGIAALPEKDI